MSDEESKEYPYERLHILRYLSALNQQNKLQT